MKTTYEYTIETFDTDGDIIEVWFFNTRKQQMKASGNETDQHRCGVIKRITYSDWEQYRGHAYYDKNGQLPLWFDNQDLIPYRFHKELKAHF